MKLNNIKKSLDQRSIAPRADSWEKLSQRLDEATVQQPSKKPFTYWIAAVAAVLIIAIMVVAQVSNKVETTNTRVVKQNNVPAVEKSMHAPLNEVNSKPQGYQRHTTSDTQKSAVAATQNKSQQVQQQPVVIKEELPINNQTNRQQTVQDANNSALTAAIAAQENKVESVPAALKLTAAQEADVLLERAMGSLKTSKKSSTTVVHADRLLQETEWDIEADRRNRIEHMLLDQFGKLKAHATTLVAKK